MATDVPISRDSSKIEMPAASASVAKVWRRWYGPRLARPHRPLRCVQRGPPPQPLVQERDSLRAHGRSNKSHACPISAVDGLMATCTKRKEARRIGQFDAAQRDLVDVVNGEHMAQPAAAFTAHSGPFTYLIA